MFRFTVVLLLLLAGACSEGGEDPFLPMAKRSDGDDVAAAADRKLVRTARLTIDVEDPAHTRLEIEDYVAREGGHVEQVDARGRNCSLVLRVPEAKLGDVLAQIRGVADEVVSESQDAKDVTDQSIDLEARLTSLRATEQELLALLKESRERESGVEGIMAVHRELTDLRTGIEQAEAQRKALEGRVAYATIKLWIRSDPSDFFLGWAFRPVRFAGRCLAILVALLKVIGYGVIFLVVVVLPLVLLFYVPLRFLGHWRSRRRAHAVPPLPGD